MLMMVMTMISLMRICERRNDCMNVCRVRRPYALVHWNIQEGNIWCMQKCTFCAFSSFNGLLYVVSPLVFPNNSCIQRNCLSIKRNKWALSELACTQVVHWFGPDDENACIADEMPRQGVSDWKKWKNSLPIPLCLRKHLVELSERTESFLLSLCCHSTLHAPTKQEHKFYRSVPFEQAQRNYVHAQATVGLIYLCADYICEKYPSDSMFVSGSFGEFGNRILCLSFMSVFERASTLFSLSIFLFSRRMYA